MFFFFLPKKTLRCISHCRLSGFFYFHKLQCAILPCGVCILSAVCKPAISTKITARNIWTWLRNLSAGVDYWPSMHCVLYVSYKLRVWVYSLNLQWKSYFFCQNRPINLVNSENGGWKNGFLCISSLCNVCNDKMSPSNPFFPAVFVYGSAYVCIANPPKLVIYSYWFTNRSFITASLVKTECRKREK